jgi:hypothetical protein
MRRISFVWVLIATLALLALVPWEFSPGAEAPQPVHHGTPSRQLNDSVPEESPSRRQIEPDITKVLTVVVVDEGNLPISQAKVHDGETDRFLGETGSEGRLALHPQALDWLGISATGFRDCVVALDGRGERESPEGNMLRVTLERLWTLTGEVRRVDGLPVSEAMIVAWTGHRPSADDVWQALSGAGGILLAACDQEGRFALEVPGSGTYELAAGGRGFVTYSPDTYRAEANGDGVGMVLRPAYALMVRFRAPSGLPSISKDLHPAGMPGLLYPQGIVSVNGDHPGLVLAGVDPAWAASLTPVDRLEIMGVDGTEVPATVGPLRFEGELPGYDPVGSVLTLSGLWNGLREETIHLQPTVDGFGTIRVRLDPVAARRLDPGKLMFGGCGLRLHSVGAAHPYQYLLRDFDELGRGAIRNVPFGSYQVHLRAWDNTYHDLDPDDPGSLSLHLDLGPDDLEIDLTDLRVGSVEFDLRDTDGAPVDGRQLVNLGRLQGNGRRMSFPYHFTGRPYRIPVIQSGVYGAFVDGQWFKDVDVDGEYGFRLENDEDRVIVVRPPIEVVDRSRDG